MLKPDTETRENAVTNFQCFKISWRCFQVLRPKNRVKTARAVVQRQKLKAIGGMASPAEARPTVEFPAHIRIARISSR